MSSSAEGSLSIPERSILHDGLTSLFSLDDLEQLCFDLGIPWEEIPGNTRTAKTRELIDYFIRRGRITDLLAYSTKVRPQYPWPTLDDALRSSEGVRVNVQYGDILRIDSDVLILKYAQHFYGVDKTISGLLAPDDWGRFAPHVGGHVLADTYGKIAARRVLFVGVPSWDNFDYAQIRIFSERALEILANEVPSVRQVAMTMHGVGFGLDETESFLAQIAGILDAASSDQYPRFLERITIVENNQMRAERLQELLDRYVQGGVISLVSERETATTKSRLRHVGRESGKKRHVFVAMPFSDDFTDTYELGIRPTVNAVGFLCERIDTSSFTGDILARIKDRIETASLVIAELTDANPNVYLEVGYAWGKDRQTLLLAKDASHLKFDVQGQRSIIYKNIVDLKKQLEQFLVGLG